MRILDRLSYADAATTVTARGERQRVRAHQIIVWVSINVRNIFEWDPRLPQVPAILDTGNNHNFSISRSHLTRWAGIQPNALRPLGTMRERGERIPLHAASLWLHPNQPGTHDAAPNHEPHLLKIDEGIAIYPDEHAPRLPLLGLRALTANQLHLTVDGQQRLVWLRTLDWRTKLLRLLTCPFSFSRG